MAFNDVILHYAGLYYTIFSPFHSVLFYYVMSRSVFSPFFVRFSYVVAFNLYRIL